MQQNAKVTTFTIFELLRKNQQGGGYPPSPTQIRFKEVSEKYDGAEDFINLRIEEICSHEKLSAKEVIYFLCFLVSFLAVNSFST